MANPAQDVVIDYTNWRGERSFRRVRPLRIAFENNEWHPDTQWLMEAIDLAKAEIRTFALSKVHQWFTAAEIAGAEAALGEKFSTSFMQRKMGMSYNRAASLMEYFEKTGRVSEPDNFGRRTLFAST